MHARFVTVVPFLVGSALAQVDFARDVRPLLSNHCFACHGPDAKQRKRGLRLDTPDGALAKLGSGKRAVVPGDPAASELLRRITSDDPAIRMPPPKSGKRLTAADAETLRSWISGGAPWARHWSFVSPRRPEVPAAGSSMARHNPIDAFVRAKLAPTGLTPAPAADRTTLIRRVTFDLTGLPPTLAEIDRFASDDQPGAYERLVDRLLASAHYGEHMARFWLDAARYGDTHGYHLDNYRSMWPYRDWVIRAFARNLPFDRFLIEQLAGDLLDDPSNDQLIATGFNRCNVTTAEGGLIAEEYLATYAMDRVETTATVFLGLTARCASCHDHKYDPLSQREFYQLFAFFNSIAEEASDKNQPIAPPFTRAPSPEQVRRKSELQREMSELAEQMRAPMPEVDAAQRAWAESQRARIGKTWTVLTPRSAMSQNGATMRVQSDDSLLVTGHSPDYDVYDIVTTTKVAGIRAIRLEALPSDEQPGKGIGRASHSNIVLSALEVEAAPLDRPSGRSRVELVDATAEYSQRAYDIADTLDAKNETGWAIDRTRRPLAAIFVPREPLGNADGTVLRFRLRFESRHPQHTIGKLRLSVSTADTVLPAKLSDWRSIGPFPAKSFDLAYATDFGPEKGSGDVHGGKRYVPRPKLRDAKQHQLTGGIGATYLERTIDAPSARSMTFSVGSDDGIRAFLNGRPVLGRKVRRGIKPDQDRFTVRLRKGENRLLVKIVNAGGYTGSYFRVSGETVQPIPNDVATALLAPEPTPAQHARIRAFYRGEHSSEWRRLDARRRELDGQLAALEKGIPRTMIMREREKPRPAHVLIRGLYNRKGEAVEPGTPRALPPLAASTKRASRLDLAKWLADPEHPLTSRVTVNRFWQQLFGTGIVKTSEDFGAQGEWPSHPKLLDWLATEFVRNGWDVKKLLKLIVTSATYRQSAKATPELIARDPGNRLLARGPRFRLDAEMIRDNALAISGLLEREIGGPSVKPYQPTGIWRAVAYTSSNTSTFRVDKGKALYRRSLYTFWKRTAPPPSMALFDAPSREACRVRRERTNTPLQALTLLNDVQFVEAARAFAERMVAFSDDVDARITWGFRLATARRPRSAELATLRALYDRELGRFGDDPAAARKLVAVGESKPNPELDVRAVAASTVIANLLLNLDETITKG